MSDKSTCLGAIAKIVGVDVNQLPELTPDDFAVSDWQWIQYSTGEDIRGCTMDVWRRLGASVVCPNCKRYATEVFFQRRSKLPTVFRCGYENVVWYGYEADATLVDRILRKYNANLWCEGDKKDDHSSLRKRLSSVR